LPALPGSLESQSRNRRKGCGGNESSTSSGQRAGRPVARGTGEGAASPGARRAATAATAAAVTLAGVGTGAAASAPTAGALTALVQCGDQRTPASDPSDFAEVGDTLFFTA